MDNLDFVKYVAQISYEQRLTTMEIRAKVLEDEVVTPHVIAEILDNMSRMSTTLQILAQCVQQDIEIREIRAR